MAYVKKISDEQFTLDCINKEFEIANTGLHFDTFEALKDFAAKHRRWYANYKFKAPEEYEQWKAYFFAHFYDWQPKSCRKYEMEREFSWFDLNFGFARGYPLK